jgi:pyruvate formate lyase activating enzyme
MAIVDIQESFIDYPGKICLIIFTKSCPWNCKHCHNKHNLEMSNFQLSLEYISDYLDKSKSLINSVTISGGEPTEDPKLFDLVRIIKDKGFSIKLDTNGMHPEIVRTLLPYLSVVAMDIKETIDSYSNYHRITQCTKTDHNNVLKTIKLLSDWSLESDNHYLLFRTTLFDDKIDPDKVKDSLKSYYYDEYKVQQLS